MASEIKVDTISEKTSANGVAIDSVTLKDGGATFTGAVTVGVDDTGKDVKLFGATSGSFLLWDESADALLLTDSTPIQIGDAQDLTLYHDGSNSYITNKTGALKVATETSGIAVTIGHTTSEVSIADNLTVTGTVTLADGSLALADLDIDGGTDIGAAIVDADLFIVDDGAGGTNRKTAASRLKTYIGGGIANVDQWRTTTDAEFSGAGRHFITANWEQSDSSGFEVLGGSMTESSGVFTFPSTGKWLVRFSPGCTNRESSTNRAMTYIMVEISGTRDNSSYVQIARAYASNDDAGGEYYMSGTAELFWDVTNTSNDKVKFGAYVANGFTAKGESLKQITCATFVRMGDT